MIRLMPSCHAATVAAAGLALVFASFTLSWPAAAQMSQRQIMQMLGPMMQDENFNEELEDFAEEHNLDPNVLRAMMAKQMGKRGMSKQQQKQMQQQKQKPDND
jgi:siroheme synthase (precorrin-2 oxidase/ferrochelatase)